MNSAHFGFIFSLLALTGCALTAKNGPQARNADGIFYNKADRAPLSLSPPVEEKGQSKVIDTVYLQTQADLHFTLGETYSLSGDSKRAIEEFKLTLVYDPQSSRVRMKLAAEYVKVGQLSEAISQAEAAVESDAENVDARVLLGGLYASMRLYEKAEMHYRKGLKTNPKHKETLLYLGALLAERNQYDEAIQLFSQMEGLDEEAVHLARYYIGRVHLVQKNNKMAERYFKKSLKAKPNFLESVLALGELYENSGNRQKAKSFYNNYQDKHGPSESVADPLARLHLEDEEHDKAYMQYEIISAADPGNLNVRVRMALILIEKKDYNLAIKKLNEILAQAPDSDKIQFYLGAVYEEIKDYPAAIGSFGKINLASTFYGEANVHTAYLHKLQGDYSGAVTSIERAIKNRPDIAQFYSLYASLLDETKEYNKAVSMLDKAVQRFPKDEQLHFFLGSMHDKIGNKQKTVVSMKVVLELNPDHIQALNYLAYTYAELNINLSEAEELAHRAVKLKPDDAYIQDTLGWIFFKQGKYLQAVKTLEAAYSTKSSEGIIAEHLGDAYYRYNLPGKAKKMYQRAAALESNGENLEKLRAKIHSIENGHQDPGRIPASVEVPN